MGRPRRTTTKKKDRPTAKEKFIAKSSKPSKKVYVSPKSDRPRGAEQISKPVTPTPISSGVDPRLAAAVADRTADRATGKFSGMPASTPIGYGAGLVDPALAAAAGIGPAAGGFPGTTVGAGVGVGTGGIGVPPPDDDDEKVITEKDKEEDKKEEEAKNKSITTAKGLTKWWADNKKGQGYKERKNILTGKLWGSQEAVTAKIADKLSKGYYKIVDGPNGEPLIIHASTGTPVNPYTGNIVSTQTSGDQGGAYQNEMARITGIDPKNAGVFSKEYQTGNGLSISEMKPQHALRLLMKRNPKAFEEFFNLQKSKGFNPFSAGAISSGMGMVLSKIFGSDALKVGNNLERHEWGKAIKDEKTGKYSIKLTEKGAQGWSDSFNFNNVSFGGNDYEGFTSPEAITKDQSKGWLSDLLGTKKFKEQPIDLTNLIDQGGYFEGNQFTGFGLPDTQAMMMSPYEKSQLGLPPGIPAGGSQFANLDPYLNPEVPFKSTYSYPDVSTLRYPSDIPGTPPSQYPQFTPEGTRISGGAYTAPSAYVGAGGGGGGGGGTTPDPNQPVTQGPLTFDVYGRPITYDYTGGPEQIQLGGGWRRDGTYIGSPWGPNFKSGGIANFRPYGY